ncbi:MAG TPA: hypothetical protein VHX61_01185 [Rhizomicrobium sp.]|nr:hypothetical protein [Rhizomicrobium sp.]
MMPQRMEDAFLKAIATDVLPVVARTLVACRRAADQIDRDHSVAATAAAAFRQAREEVFWPAALTEMILGLKAINATP